MAFDSGKTGAEVLASLAKADSAVQPAALSTAGQLQRNASLSFVAGTTNATIDSAVRGAWVLGQYDASWKNVIGSASALPTSSPAIGTRTADAAYVAGIADRAYIGRGYHKVNNGLAGSIS